MDALAEVITEKLKELYNKAFVYIEDKRFEEARECYESVLTLCGVVQNEPGMKMAYISLANLFVLMEEPVLAFEMADKVLKLQQDENIDTMAKSLISKLIGPTMKSGMTFEKEGKYEKAISVYLLAEPYIKGEKKAVLNKQIEKLREIKR